MVERVSLSQYSRASTDFFIAPMLDSPQRIPYPQHVHDFSELVMVIRGAATHIVDEEEYQVAAGDVFVINGDTEHGYRDGQEFQIYNVMYNPAIYLPLKRFIRGLVGFHVLFQLEPHYKRQGVFESHLHLNAESNRQVRELLQRMRGEYVEPVQNSVFLPLEISKYPSNEALPWFSLMKFGLVAQIPAFSS